MRSILIATLLSFSFVVHAQVDRDIRILLNDIRKETEQPQDQRTLLRVRERLQSTLELLQGGGGPVPPNPNPRLNLSCISRDNDGRDPYVLGVKDPITLSVTKLPHSNIGQEANCREVKDSAVSIRESIFACVSKDNDGRDPWSIAHFKDGKFEGNINNLGKLSDCSKSLSRALRSSQAVAFCASRDNDGRAPWVQMSVVVESGETHRAGSYDTLDKCLNSKNKINLK
tara:strand:+ start:15312 stop:15995 length:684 start_codon:yes stop_codon:yes gene_type:complete